MFPKIGLPQNGWFMMGNPIEMDDLGVPPFKETPIVKTFGFTACFFFLARSWRRQWQRQWQLKVAMMVDFIEGNSEGID